VGRRSDSVIPTEAEGSRAVGGAQGTTDAQEIYLVEAGDLRTQHSFLRLADEARFLDFARNDRQEKRRMMPGK
jgi:hypothetical protein